MPATNNLPQLTLKHIEVGGWRLPVWYHTYAVGDVNITVRYSRESYVRLSYDASDRHVKVTVPEDLSDMVIEEWKHGRFSKRRTYRLSGERIDATVGQIFNAVSAKEIGEALKPLREYFAQNLDIA
jgi:hypothetical protein